MECGEDCGCGAACQNQRFQQRQYADVTVIKTEKKGYGLRTNTELKPNDFIFEYIGEVIGENAFRKRMQNYDEEGIKHFYFMSLTKGEFVDATKRGNLGRFCNHSCNPNCYVDKWVVGDKLRMGIFAERRIQAGEELVFNYNVDRYGAEPQPCYCGEPNCTGYIGGKTQTERATKLSNTIIEALGIDDADAWDTAVAKRPRKKKASEDDEEYVNNVEPRGLDEDGVNKVMSSLMQCKEKWIAVKLLSRIQRADDEKVRNRVVRFHGYRILKTVLSNFVDDVNVCLQVFDVLERMPRITRNKINDSKIEETVQPLTESEDERVAAQAKGLMEAWSKLEIGYRIPRMKRDPNAAVPDRKAERMDRRGDERRKSRSRSRSKSQERIKAPTGPKNNAPQRPVGFRPPSRFRPPPPPGPLPAGWHETTAQNGGIYYWNDAGATTWQRPTAPAPNAPPPPPSKAMADQMMLQDLINNIIKSDNPKQSSATPTPAETPKKQSKEEKWKALPEEKQRKIYESTISPHIMQEANKHFRHKLSKDDFKRLARDLTKSVASSDYRKGRVQDPTKLSEKQAKGLRNHTHEYFTKFVKKMEARRAQKKEKSKTQPVESHTPEGSPPPAIKEEMDVDGSDAEGDVADMTPAGSSDTPAALKRRRDDNANGADGSHSPKKMRVSPDEEDATAGAATPPPPPPPPPPAGEPIYGEPVDENSTLTPDEDVSGSFTHDAIAAVHDATFEAPVHANGDAETRALPVNGRPGSTHAFDKAELTQMATPPTTGSPDAEEVEKTAKRQTFAGMNPERMRQLGLYDGAGD